MATANSQLGAALVSDIGAPGTHLRLVRDRKIRIEIAKKLRDGALDWPPAVRLRAILAIGKIPPAELITTEVLSQALPPEDCARNLSKLTRRTLLIDSHNALNFLKSSSSRVIDAELPLFATSLQKAIIQWTNRKELPATIDSKSADAFASFLETLIWSFKSSPSSQGKRRRNTAAALVMCFKLLLVHAKDSNTRSIRWRCLAISQAAEQSMSSEFGHALDSPDLGAAIDSIIQAAVNDVEEDAKSGKAEQFRKSSRILARIARAQPASKRLLDSLWSDRGILSLEIQHVLAELLARPTDSREAQLPDSFPESVSSVQLASALTRSWAASATSPEAEQAYLELSSVLSNFFGIDMRGTVGETAVFDPRIHELVDAKQGRDSDRVKIVRPRVELTEGDTVRILLKALVAPVN